MIQKKNFLRTSLQTNLITKKTNLLKFFLFCSLTLTFLSCQNQVSSKLLNSSSSSSLSSAFKNSADFDIEDIIAGDICPSLDSNDIKIGQYYAWPADLKDVMLTELSKASFIDRAGKKLRGIYLVDFSYSERYEGTISGLTCHHVPSDTYVVWVSNDLTKIERNRKALDFEAYTYYGTTEDESVTLIENRGDELFQTLIHEFMHVIDLGYYENALTNYKSKNIYSDEGFVRSKIFDFSWVADLKKGKISSKFPVNNLGSGTLAQEFDNLKSLETTTNFITHFAAENYAEDFAVSLETYYIGKHYGFWYSLKTTDSSEPEISAKSTFNTSAKHREKICYMASKILNDHTCQ